MNSQQDSRKILEDLNYKKQQLQKTGLPIISPTVTPQSQPYEPSINTAARATYQQAQSSSFGFFIATDSSFGNSILPVLPRFNSEN